jgi:hypothetical protein
MRKSTIALVIGVGVLASLVNAESPVYFEDPNLKLAVEQELGKSNPTPTDMLSMGTLHAHSKGITSLTGLECASKLSALMLDGNRISDIDALSGLSHLTVVDLEDNQISDISAASTWTDLRQLVISNNQVADFSPLSGLTKLRLLTAHNNDITDVSSFSGLTGLTLLQLAHNQISSISELSGLVNLTELEIIDNKVDDISIITSLTQLKCMHFSMNQIEDISAIAAFRNLEIVQVQSNPLNQNAYCADLSAIYGNNPGVLLYYDWNPVGPSSVSASDGAYTDKVVITWDTLCSGPLYHMFYRVLRSTSLTGSKETIATAQAATSFEDTTAVRRQVYYYWIQSTPYSNPHVLNGGDYSEPDTGFAGLPQHTLTVSTSDGGSVLSPGVGSYQYDQGASVPLWAIANVGFSFTGWTGTAADAGKVVDPVGASTKVTVDADYTLQANFVAVSHALTVFASSGGSVTKPGEGTFSYPLREQVVLEAEAVPGYHFVEWSGSFASSDNPTSLEMNADYTVTANFAPDDHTLTVSSGDGGRVVAPGEGIFTCKYDASVHVVAVPNCGYRFARWTGTLVTRDSVADPNASQIDVVVQADSTLQASFAPVSASLYVDNSAPGDPEENGTPQHPFDTIQEAINAAGDGEAVLVKPGVYTENLRFRGKSITLSSLDPQRLGGMAQTILEGGRLGSVVTFDANDSGNCVLAGLTITGGNAELGGGIRCIGAHPIIANCVIAGNVANAGAGLYLHQSGATLVNCTITENSAAAGGGLYCDGNVMVVNSIVWNNQAQQIVTDSASLVSVTYSDVQGGWPGLGNIDANPRFAAPGHWTSTAVWVGGDYHLKSGQGRWDPVRLVWVQDTENSPCIDAGNPHVSLQSEVSPNGGRINCGAYGGTIEASQSQAKATGH